MSMRCERVRRIDVVCKVLERIPRFIDEVTRIRGVDLYVGVRKILLRVCRMAQ